MTARRALVLSPFATVPADAGQRRRALQTTRLLADAGYDITFVLYAFEDGWKARVNEHWRRDLLRQWPETLIWRAEGRVGQPPAEGEFHHLDEWWEPSLETLLTKLVQYNDFAVVVVHNVWLSRALDFLPKRTVRVIDTHDVFSRRIAAYRAASLQPDFFAIREEAELFGIDRSDIALMIQGEEAEWLSRKTDALVVNLPYFETSPTAHASNDYQCPDKVVFGFLGSAHPFNQHGLKAFLSALKREVGERDSPVELLIGGKICESVEGRGPWTLCGYVGDEAEFFAKVDVVLAPVFAGSGFSVKTFDAIRHGKPLLAAAHAAKGLALTPEVVAETPAELAKAVVDVAERRPPLAALRRPIERARIQLQVDCERGTQTFLRALKRFERVVIYDLRGFNDRRAAAVLLSWTGAMHVLNDIARQYVLSDAPWVAELVANAPPSVHHLTHPKADIVERAALVVSAAAQEGAQPEDASSHHDAIWARAFGSAGDGVRCDGRGLFWHNSRWDPMLKGLIAQLARDGQPTLAGTVLVLAGDRAARVGAELEALFDGAGAAISLDDETTFLDCLAAVCQRAPSVVVLEEATSPRALILARLCVACSVPVHVPPPHNLPSQDRADRAFETFWRENLWGAALRDLSAV
ncbi:MAG: glycosyltransferase family 4 protein [Hyphomonadaceae bacterium]|nr:glycosyltransferase family 4 protein [Hyphomonadaceae bacterium]